MLALICTSGLVSKDNLIGGMFLMKFSMILGVEGECKQCLDKLRFSLQPTDNNQDV
jgi:hypothetical protein